MASRSLVAFDHKKLPPAFGLINSTGISCHFNSLLQCIMSCPVLMDALKKSDSPIAAELRNILNDADNETSPKTSHYIFQRLIEAIQSRKDRVKFSMSAQQSACEGLVLLVDAINDETVNRLLNHKYSLHITCPVCKKETSTQTDYSIYMLMPAVNFPDEAEFCRYITNRKEIIESYKCEKCGVTSKNVERIILLKVLPEIVIILLNKYNGKVRMWFPDKLTFTSVKGTKLIYGLTGQIEHFGTQNSGHYVARGVRKNGIFLFNDSSVSPATFTRSADTTILFYVYGGGGRAPPP